MRRLIYSKPGTAVCYLITVALLLPFLTFVTATRAEAQVESLPTWAVLEFVNLKDSKTNKYGKAAAEAVFSELAKSNKYDMTPAETVDREMANLGFQAPISRQEDVLRLARNLNASTMVTGELKDYRIVPANGGKRADVLLRVMVRDTASGELVNGSALQASSQVRMGEVEDDTLVSEALAAAAFDAVRSMEAVNIPSATVLNTLEKQALVNKGSRSGFKVGQKVLVLRGREQVAAATVSEVEPETSFIKVDRSFKGVQPGDRVRGVFSVPEIKGFGGGGGGAVIAKPSKAPNFTAILSILIILGIVFFLLSRGKSTNQNVVEGVSASARLDNVGQPSVTVNFDAESIFGGGNRNKFAWQIWRNDVPNTPVLVVNGDVRSAIDSNDGRTVTWYRLTPGGPSGGGECPGPGGEDVDTIPPLVAGTPYTYSVELVYRLSPSDIGVTTGSTGGTTGGTTGLTTGGSTGLTTGGGTGLTTGGGTGLTTGRVMGDVENSTMMRPWSEPMMAETTGLTTGGTTGTTTGGDDGWCYFVTTRVAAAGTATPLAAPNLTAPDNNAQIDITVPRVFQFQSARGAAPITLEYVLQLSPDATFRTNVHQAQPLVDNQAGGLPLSTAPINLLEVFAKFPGTKVMWWRIGVKNVGDVPGPIGGYMFSPARQFSATGGEAIVLPQLAAARWR